MMGKEFLCIPEKHLRDVIKIIRIGINQSVEGGWFPDVSKEATKILEEWCNDEEEYLQRLNEK